MRCHRPLDPRRGLAVLAIPLALLLLGVTACGDDDDGSASTSGTADACAPSDVPDAIDARAVSDADTDGTTITLVTHDSFAVSDGIFDEFTKTTGITVKQLTQGDAGSLVSQSVLTAGKPVGDVLFGIDNTFLCRGLDAGVFVPYESPALTDVDASLQMDPNHFVTPIDVGDVCVNYGKDMFTGSTPPADLDDLTSADHKDQFVTENPETSSPGFAFLLATIAKYGDGWEDYWAK